MIWLAATLAVPLVHVGAIVVGRLMRDRLERIAFTSGLAGVLGFPVLAYFAVKSFCIAGMCRHIDNTGLYLAAAVFAVVALLSLGSAAALVVRPSRA